MKKALLFFILSLSLNSCITYDVLYINRPQFNSEPVIEDDSIYISFWYNAFVPFTVTMTVVNISDEPFSIIWNEATIDDKEIGFPNKYLTYDYLSELIKPNASIEREIGIKEDLWTRLDGFFSSHSIETWGYSGREIIIPVQFDSHRRDYYLELGLTWSKKRRLKKPPRFKEENLYLLDKYRDN